jgi:CTP:molybdopterin cytidylyltransferase MocA
MDVAIVILAAGASSRMGGRDKLLEPVAGEPLVARVARIAAATGCPVTVVLPHDRPARRAALAGLPVAVVEARDAARGMSASLRAGLATLAPGAAAAMILPADMPGLATEDLGALIAAHRADPARILRGATADGRPGHPVLFPADLLPALAAATGDTGGRAVIAANPERVRLVPLAGDRAVLDLDTPADWAAFRARSGGEQQA